MSNYDIYAAWDFHPFITSFAVLTHIASFDHIPAIFFLQFIHHILQPAFFLLVRIPQAQLADRLTEPRDTHADQTHSLIRLADRS
jgi:hypothetical protein